MSEEWFAKFVKDVPEDRRRKIENDPDIRRAVANQDWTRVETLAIAFGNIVSPKLAKQEEQFKKLKNELNKYW